MHLTENVYEQKLLLNLPPHARDIAEDFLSLKSLGELLKMQLENNPDMEVLNEKKVPRQYWLEILNAAVLAKATYFLPNKDYTQKELIFLLQQACQAAGYPLPAFSLTDAAAGCKEEMPVFHNWLKQQASLLTADSITVLHGSA